MPTAPTRDQFLTMESERWMSHRDRTFTVALTGADLEVLCGALQLINSVEAPRLFQLPPGGTATDPDWQSSPELVELRQLVTRRGELHKRLAGIIGSAR
jgi:hypothetical protein